MMYTHIVAIRSLRNQSMYMLYEILKQFYMCIHLTLLMEFVV